MFLTCTMCLTEQVRQLERSIGLKDLAMAEMEEKIRNMEASTYDGVFIWKITEFARKRQEAITGRSPAIFSPGVQNLQNLLRSSCVGLMASPLLGICCQGQAEKIRLRKRILHVEGGVLSWRVKQVEQCCSKMGQRTEGREVQAVDGMRKGIGCNCLVCIKYKGKEIPGDICVKEKEVDLLLAVL